MLYGLLIDEGEPNGVLEQISADAQAEGISGDSRKNKNYRCEYGCSENVYSSFEKSEQNPEGKTDQL